MQIVAITAIIGLVIVALIFGVSITSIISYYARRDAAINANVKMEQVNLLKEE
jgi:heme/copper-type cytochrome/quinol oxidase subunit 2